MITLLSPAKKLDTSPVEHITPTLPDFQDEANALARVARDLSVPELQKLMGISEALATLNADRFRDFASLYRARSHHA